MFAKSLRRVLCSIWGAAILLMAGNSRAEYPLNLPEGVTTTSKTVYDLHMLIFWICVIACVATFAVLIYSIFKHRKSKGAVPATFHESTTVEIIWTTIPFLMLVGMAVPATKTLLALEDTSDADMTIKVTGYQWKWKYDYLDEGISFFSNLDAKSNEIRQLGSGLDPADHEHYLLEVDNRVVVPINKKIRFLITANDVIHCLVGAGSGLQAGRHPRLHQRRLDRVDRAGHLPRPVCRAVRQGPRLHADRAWKPRRKRTTSSGSPSRRPVLPLPRPLRHRPGRWTS